MSYVGLGNAFGSTVSLPAGFDAGKLPYCGTVRALQTTLGGIGYDVGKVDGKWGTNTAKGATAFAQAKGLNVSGGITKNFCQALQSEWVASMAPPTPSVPAPPAPVPGAKEPPPAGRHPAPPAEKGAGPVQTPAQAPPVKAGLSTGAKVAIGGVALVVVFGVVAIATGYADKGRTSR